MKALTWNWTLEEDKDLEENEGHKNNFCNAKLINVSTDWSIEWVNDAIRLFVITRNQGKLSFV